MRAASFQSLRQFGRYVWFFKTTTPGKFLISSIIVVAIVASASLEVPAYHLLTSLSALVVVALILGVATRPRVRVSGRFPDKAVAGEPVQGEYRISNQGRRAIFDLAVGFFGLPSSLREVESTVTAKVIAPSQSQALPLAVQPLRRGLYPMPPVRPFSTFPFNLFRIAATYEKKRPRPLGASLLVLPAFHAAHSIDVPISERYQPGGIALSSNVGESPEYVGNREYRAGDSTRNLDHRSWARLGRPVVKEYQEEFYCRIALVLDTYIPGKLPAPDRGFNNLEAAISLAAAVADVLARGEYILDIFAAGPELYVFRAGRHTAHFENVLEVLACVEPCRQNPFGVVTPALADELANISTVICVLLDWDLSRETLVRAAIDSGCSVKVYLIRAEPPAMPITGMESVSIEQHRPDVILERGLEEL